MSLQYKRGEPFRYEFKKPRSCTFGIVSVGSKVIDSKRALGQILDISTGGAKFQSNLALPLQSDSIQIRLTFQLTGAPLEIEGTLLWQKQYGAVYQYGLEFRDEEISKRILTELKSYAKLERAQQE
ncbi:PilZ domain-containing protein [Priestia koreensis]|uniref:PilZ domain-containing protein n=1 Tax=Priestia koreensis TaxID=284581 RepID=UPI00345A270B